MRIRKIDRFPPKKHYYIIDTNFLVNRFIPLNRVMNENEKKRVESCMEWWKIIDEQIKNDKAKIFIPDICIAEAFKVLAKRYYKEKDKEEKLFKNYQEYSQYKKKLSKFVRVSIKDLTKRDRKIAVHDISTNRDIIISVDRFFEIFSGEKVQIADLIVLATAKYRIDFYDFDKNDCSIISLDNPLRKGAKKLTDIPYIYDPTMKINEASKVFK